MSRVVHTNIWSAYGYARKAGYEGTEEEFEQGLKKSAEAAGNAEESAYTASEAATEADAARDAAAQSAESASTSEGNALEYANSAAQVLRDAQAVAQTVNAKATEAAGSASRAENYAQTATTKASEAATAAGTATTAATSASGSAQAADASATAAAASETNAAASASSASTSAGSASESADDAAESAAAAQAVKDSIPADYSQLSADVTDLKSALGEDVVLSGWVEGGINANTGATNTYNTRARLELRLPCEYIQVHAGENYYVDAGVWVNGTFVGIWNGETCATGTLYTQKVISIKKLIDTMNPSKIIIVARNLTNTVLDQSDVPGNILFVSPYYVTTDQFLTANYQFPALPNIVFQCRGLDDIPPESKWYVKEAVNNQYDRVRFTVRKTTDGYYFNCHDANINNYVVNQDGSALTESVSATGKTLAELNQYDWGLKYGAQYAGATVPLLEECLKYASMFNLGVTWHSATTEVETQESVTEQLAMIDKYGLTDNLIVACSAGFNLATFQRFLAHNKRISYYVGGLPAFFNDEYNIGYINSLKTNYNKIYVQLYPWGTTPTAEFIELAKENDWELYDSITTSESDLCNESMFSKGYSLREVYNVRMVKDTVRRWANGLIT